MSKRVWNLMDSRSEPMRLGNSYERIVPPFLRIDWSQSIKRGAVAPSWQMNKRQTKADRQKRPRKEADCIIRV